MTQNILFVGGAKLDGSVRHRLEQNGFAVSVIKDSAPAFARLNDSRIDLVIVNLTETEDGARLIKQLRKVLGTKATRLLAVADWGTGLPTVALATGADAYEPAPIDAERLVDAVKRLLHKRTAVVRMNN